MILIIEERYRNEGEPLINIAMTSLSTTESLIRVDRLILIIEETERKKRESLINVSVTPLSTPESYI